MLRCLNSLDLGLSDSKLPLSDSDRSSGRSNSSDPSSPAAGSIWQWRRSSPHHREKDGSLRSGVAGGLGLGTWIWISTDSLSSMDRGERVGEKDWIFSLDCWLIESVRCRRRERREKGGVCKWKRGSRSFRKNCTRKDLKVSLNEKRASYNDGWATELEKKIWRTKRGQKWICF